ncbi:hypothetical protein EDD17DRAFT_1895150 [Pisolithus thermaeus]|nr:hypothetical protein EDD17DRAFT_1895150 [Pisolithus thermaeus]
MSNFSLSLLQWNETCSTKKFVLFYGAAGKRGLSNSTPEDLDGLSNACQPATFGVNKEDVYDESYRKAGKPDITDFATSFESSSTSLIDVIRNVLLEGRDEKRGIKVDMYKLNVYVLKLSNSPQAKIRFFKAHKDTPHGETMFGSLVVVFPTPHQGGEFVLRQDGHDWVVDFARMIPETAENPGLLYTLLSNPDLLPEGGYLGFVLRRQYTVQTHMEVKQLWTCLKRNDAVLAGVLSALGITWNVRVLYDNDKRYPRYLHERIVDMDDKKITDVRLYGMGAEEVRYTSLDGKVLAYYDNRRTRKLAKVTEMASMTYAKSSFLAYGNEPSLEHLYGSVYRSRFTFGKPHHQENGIG